MYKIMLPVVLRLSLIARLNYFLLTFAIAGILFVHTKDLQAVTVFLNDGSQLSDMSPLPDKRLPVLFVHGHKPAADSDLTPNYIKNWQTSLSDDLPSFTQTLDLPENNCLGIEPYYLHFEDQHRSIAIDAQEIGDAVDLIIDRHRQVDPNNPNLKVVIIAYSKGTISTRKYIRDKFDNNLDIPVSEFIAIAPPNHGLRWPGLLFTPDRLSSKQLNNGYDFFCNSLGVNEAADFIATLNGHPITDTQSIAGQYPSEAPGSRANNDPPENGVLYVTLYADNNGDFVGGDDPSGDCQGRVLAKNLAPHAQNIEVSDIPTQPGVGFSISGIDADKFARHQNTVHFPEVIVKALYTAVHHQIPPNNLAWSAVGSIPVVPLSEDQPPDSAVVLLFDTSGSMNRDHAGNIAAAESHKRLSLAKQAAIPFLWMLDYFNLCQANFGIAAFPRKPLQGCLGEALTDLTRVEASSIDTAIGTTVPGLEADGYSPLLAGIDAAMGMFGSESHKALVVLSDGFQNCPLIGGPNDSQVTERVEQLNSASIKTYTIGFGQSAEVPHDLLNQFGPGTNGQYYDVTTAPNFNPDAWDPGNDLQETYKSILVDALNLESAADPAELISSGKTKIHDVNINEHDQKVLFYLSWVTPNSTRLSLEIKSSDGINIPLADAHPGIRMLTGNTFKIVALDKSFLKEQDKVGPQAWQIEIRLAGQTDNTQEKYQYSVISRSDLKMKTGFNRKFYHAGEAVKTTAALTEGGRQLVGLKNIYVKITRPEEGMGNWFAKHSVNIEELDQIPAKEGLEILSPVHRKAIYLTKNRKVAFPMRKKPQTLQLFDDGTHGDTTADDGVYTNNFTDTVKQGTYTFYFQISGKTAGGIPFKRESVVDKFISVKADAALTETEVVRIPADSSKRNIFEIAVTPRDALGNYAGPGFAGSIRLKASSGKLIDTPQDLLDGTYTQVLQLSKGTDPGKVDIAADILGTSLNFKLTDKISIDDSAHGSTIWFLVCLLIVSIVILVVLWLKLQMSG